MTSDIKHFNSVNTDLLPGINLIEASAGTGKTYAIAMLVLRFVVEQNVDIKQILVVTFTKAATEELKDRIRSRLAESRQAIINCSEGIDPNLKQWLEQQTIEPRLILQRLNSALLDIDQAGIFTIHGFCQRMLAEHALESGQLFDSELTADISSIKQASADDFWRKQVYSCSVWEASLLMSQNNTPDQLLSSVDYIAADLLIFPEYENLDEKIGELKQKVRAHKNSIISSLQVLTEKQAEGKFKKSFTDFFNESKNLIVQWLNEDGEQIANFSMLTKAGLYNALNGQKFKTSKANPLPSEEQKQLYLTELEINFEPFDQINRAIQNISLFFRRALLHNLREDLDKRLQQLNILSFDDLINRLADALNLDKAETLCQGIRQKYRVALIDEFQDTDKYQWHIFSTLFRSSEHFLYLIGDPKQAIYKFRGADINTYFSAQQQAQHFFTLSHNWRSQPQLVTAINALFSRENAFFSKELAFNPVDAALTKEAGVLTLDDQEIPPLVLWQLDNIDKGHWSSGKASVEINRAVVNEIVTLLSDSFKISKAQQSHEIKPKDIAILVRNNQQAREFQQALNETKITAVINSKESVFFSVEASNLYTLLQAVSQPGNHSLLKQALMLDWFVSNGRQLLQIFEDEVAIDNWVTRFQGYQQDWQNKGLMVMMRRLLSDENVYANLCSEKQAERIITNIQHCVELVQEAAIEDHLGINKTLDWLHRSITQAASNNSSADEQQLRLESDEEAVQIITMHSAKGLEYSIVFCPFLWQRGTALVKQQNIIKCHSKGEMIADLGSDKFEQHRLIALDEELSEDLRVFYVAVTRAKYRCYINWADVRTKDKANNSAMAYLLNFSNDDFTQQHEKLHRYSKKNASAFEYRLLQAGQVANNYNQAQSLFQPLHYQIKKRSLFSFWQMSSYTALSSLSIQETPELPPDKAREDADQQTEEKKFELPRGAHTGNVIHDLLENISFKQLAEKNDISLLRDKACLRYGLSTEDPEVIDRLLSNTVNTALSFNNECFSLQQLNENQCLKEMPFYLSMRTVEVNKINQILLDTPTFQRLSDKTLCGYLTGFIDLVCEYNDKYYLIDYKSNSLESYDNESLIKAMKEHNYGLQYWIYSVVLHQYLQNKLPGYDYDEHFGGVKYLFVRGMKKELLNSGVFQTIPDFKKIEQLAELIIPVR